MSISHSSLKVKHFSKFETFLETLEIFRNISSLDQMSLVKAMKKTCCRCSIIQHETSIGDSRLLHKHSWKISSFYLRFCKTGLSNYSSFGYCRWESLLLYNVPQFTRILYTCDKKHCLGILSCCSKTMESTKMSTDCKKEHLF